MATYEVYDHAEGVRIIVELGHQLAANSAVKIEGQRPDRTTFVWTTTISDYDAGDAYYNTLPADWNQEGTWKLQAVYYPPGSTNGIPGDDVEVTVKKRLKAVS